MHCIQHEHARQSMYIHSNVKLFRIPQCKKLEFLLVLFDTWITRCVTMFERIRLLPASNVLQHLLAISIVHIHSILLIFLHNKNVNIACWCWAITVVCVSNFHPFGCGDYFLCFRFEIGLADSGGCCSSCDCHKCIYW